MKKLFIILGLMVGITGSGFGQIITVQIDPNTSTPAAGTLSLASQAGGTWGISTPSGSNIWKLNDYAADGTTLLSQVQLFNQTTINGTAANTQFDTDPAIHYALGVSNDTDATQTYTLTFSLPLSTTLLAGQQVQVSSSISGSVSDGGTDGVSIGNALGLNPGNPTNPDIQQAYIGTVTPADDAGVDLLGSSFTISPTDTQSFGPFPATTSPNTTTYTLSANATSLDVVTSFTLSANDSASFSGKFIVTPITMSVPEPSEEVLLVAGLGALIFGVLRRRSSGL